MSHTTVAPVSPRPGVRSLLRDALLGTEQDFTTGSIGRAVTLLSIPMVLEMAMESLFGIVDVWFVARLGSDPVAVVGLTESMLTILFGVALGMSMAATATVARRTGEGNREGAAEAAVQAILLGIAFSAVFGVVGVVWGPDLLRLMGASESVQRIGGTYVRVMIGGSASIFLLFLVNAIYRGAGDAAMAMRVLWLANAINLVLDPCLIFGLGPFPELGVTGAAVSTTTGRTCGVLFALWHMRKGDRRLSIPPSAWRASPAVMGRLLRLSLSGMVQFLIATASWLALVRICAVFGSAALAGYTIAIRIVIFSILPSWGMSNAAATLVGQNLGAGKPERAEKSVWLTGFYNMCFLGAVSVVFIFFPGPLLRLFTQDAAVVAVGADCLRFLAYDYVLFAYGMVIVQAFNGAGDTVTPAVINLFCYWLFQIPLAYALAIPFGFGPRGVFIAIMLTEAMVALVGIAVFRRGRWKRQVV